MHGDSILFFDKSHPLLVLCILSENKKILNVRSFNFIGISTQIRTKFSTNVGISLGEMANLNDLKHDLTLS